MAVQKFDGNPIITKDDVPFKVNSIFNAGAIKIGDKYLLLCRTEMPTGRSTITLATSKDGVSFTVAQKPTLTPEDHGEYFDYVKWGIEDCRITKIEEKYYLTYTGYSKYQPLVILSETQDFEKFIIHGPISEPPNKDCTIFPEKIDGFYWKIDRPSAFERRDVWISRSPDLLHWGSYKVLMEPTKGTWEHHKIGSSSDPIKTDKGWLMLYHGVRELTYGAMYKLGAVLLDLEKPWVVKGKISEPIIAPDYEFERVGDVSNVVFANGWITEPDGEIKIYYSGADLNICLATTTKEYLLSLCT